MTIKYPKKKRGQLDWIILSVAFGSIHNKEFINAPFILVMLCVDRQMAKQRKNHWIGFYETIPHIFLCELDRASSW